MEGRRPTAPSSTATSRTTPTSPTACSQLYQTTFDERWFVAARELADAILEHFADDDGGFFDTSDDHEELLRRPRSEEDNAMPSGGAMATLVLVQLAAYTGDDRYAAAAEAALQLMAEDAATMPLGFAQWLVALDLYLAPPVEVAIVGEESRARSARRSSRRLLAVVRSAFRPHVVVAAATAAASADAEHSAVPLLAGRRPVDGRAAAYVCRRFACAAPCTDAAEPRRALPARLSRLRSVRRQPLAQLSALLQVVARAHLLEQPDRLAQRVVAPLGPRSPHAARASASTASVRARSYSAPILSASARHVSSPAIAASGSPCATRTRPRRTAPEPRSAPLRSPRARRATV